MRRNRVTRICQTCGSTFERVASNVRGSGQGRYCSRQCIRRPDVERFWPKVNKNGPVPEHRPELGPCWIWTAAPDQNGYGRMWSTSRGRPALASRLSWEIEYGADPGDFHVCHHCDNPACVRPSHLFLGSRSQNMRDMHSKGRYPTTRPSAKVHRGSDAKIAKLTEDDIRVIRTRAAAGETATIIAMDYPVSDKTIGYAIRRETWRHVE